MNFEIEFLRDQAYLYSGGYYTPFRILLAGTSVYRGEVWSEGTIDPYEPRAWEDFARYLRDSLERAQRVDLEVDL